jgi:hypothetical protein
MPRWDVHISFGLMAFIIVISALFFGARGDEGINEMLPILYFFSSIIALGGGALIIGSVLPDIDGKGKIKWIIGPVVGGMLLIPPLIGAFRAGGPIEAMDLITGYGAVLFLSGTIGGYLFLLVPKKHRGIWHSNRTGFAYGLVWGFYVFYTSTLAMDQSIMIGSMGAVGYGWHLALDGRLF